MLVKCVYYANHIVLSDILTQIFKSDCQLMTNSGGWNRNICFTYTFSLTSAAQVTLERPKGKKGNVPTMPWRHTGGAEI